MAREINMTHCCAVLLDTVSIQKFIFQSNKLKENLGASFLVDRIFQHDLTKNENPAEKDHLDLKTVINEIFQQQLTHLHHWKTHPEKMLIHEKPVEIAYVGGGNALIFFQDANKAEQFIQTWTARLLIYAPGIQTAVALTKNFDLDQNKFLSERDALLKRLKKNQQLCIPQTIIPQHGITAECTRSGYSMDVWNNKTKEPGYVSSMTHAKILAAKESNEKIKVDYQAILNQCLNDGQPVSFAFSDQLEDLGCMRQEDNIIAIVHIDGNSMGNRFNRTQSLASFRNLSIEVDRATKTAFGKLLDHIVKHYDDIMRELGFDLTEKDVQKKVPVDDNNTRYLPIRPIILGGDDLTFVCAGKLGIYFSEKFLTYFAQETVSDPEPLTASAGVVIANTSYPFYRGYHLAEELCANAKKIRATEGSNEGTFIDFHVSSGGFAGSLEQIRHDNYRVAQGNLLLRPYQLGADKLHPRSYEHLLKNVEELDRLPNSKIHQLREVLTQTEEISMQFVKQLHYHKKKLPQFCLQEKEKTQLFYDFSNDTKTETFAFTPYFDMIELMANYPVNFLQEGGIQ
jgi:hypothetical protein